MSSSQIRSPVELGIEDQPQIFNIGTHRESGPIYARKRVGRNLISPSEMNCIGLGGVDRQFKIPTPVQ